MPSAAPANEPRVVVGIVSTNDIQNILGCLKSLSVSDHRNFWIVICENGGLDAFEHAARCLADADFIRGGQQLSGDDEPEVAWAQGCARFRLANGGQPVVLLKSSVNRGYAGGVNACIAAAAKASWDAIWVLNPDTFPEPNALAALARRQQAGGYGVVGSRLVTDLGRPALVPAARTRKAARIQSTRGHRAGCRRSRAPDEICLRRIDVRDARLRRNNRRHG